MTLTSTAELTLQTSHWRAVQGSLSPELGERIPRTKVTVEGRENEVVVKIEAEDQTALRAALNSYIRWMNVAQETAREAVRG